MKKLQNLADSWLPNGDTWLLDMTSSKGIYTFDNEKENPLTTKGFKYFVLVGGGYWGFKTRFAAMNYYKSS